jgi:hypothetical protein
VRGILVDTLPRTDADLVRSSDDLVRLESDVAAATSARDGAHSINGQGE